MLISIVIIFITFIVSITVAWIWYFKKSKPSYEVLYQMGLKEFNNNNYEKAEKLFSQALALQDTYKEARYQLGLVNLKLEKYDDAKENLEKYLKVAPKDFNALFNMGVVCEHKESYDEAKEFYGKALKENPDDGECNFNFGKVNLLQKNYDVAKEYLEKSSDLLPDINKSAASFQLIKCKEEALYEETVEAQQVIIDEYLKFETENPNNLPNDFHITLAKAYAKSGKMKESFESCQKSLEINSDDVEVYKQMALMQLLKKDLVGAKKTLSTALNLDPKNEELHNLLAYLLCQQLSMCEAKKCREKYHAMIKKKFK